MLPKNIFSAMSKKRAVLVLLLSLLLLGATVAGTLAYLRERSVTRENQLIPVMVDSAPIGTANGAVAVQNTGDITAYLRATVVVTWVLLDDEGNATATHHALAPTAGSDYTITYHTDNGWKKGSDGYWYYSDPVGAGGITPDLIASISRPNTAEVPEGYRLSVEIATSGIQAAPTRVVEEIWTVTASGITITPN